MSAPQSSVESSGSALPLPPIPAKRYFTIGEVSELCGVKPHVLRYWEQEFTQLRPMKRRGNRRYYQHHEVLLVRRIRDLLYEQGFTISGARNRLGDAASAAKRREMTAQVPAVALSTDPIDLVDPALASTLSPLAVVRAELEAALVLLDVASASSAETT
jgi:DNA-binding transcriptional MerR regulator